MECEDVESKSHKENSSPERARILIIIIHVPVHVYVHLLWWTKVQCSATNICVLQMKFETPPVSFKNLLLLPLPIHC